MFGHGRRIHDARYAQAQYDASLAAELCELANELHRVVTSQREQRLLPSTLAAFDDPGVATIAARDADRIWELLDDLEMWPGIRVCGTEGERAAWQLVMVADLDLQHRALEHLEIAVELGDAPAVHLVTLEDRINMREGRAQRYGTQVVLAPDHTTVTPWPIEDAANVDARRAALGMSPLTEHLGVVQAGLAERSR